MKTLYASNKNLARDKKATYLSADATLGTETLTAQSITGFAINQILLIGEFGDETAEIIKTHAATAPTGSTITLASNLAFNHPQDTKVYILDYDQVEISHAATEAGAKSVLATENIQADQKHTQYNDSTASSGYYFLRFKNSIETTYSEYSDPVPFADFADNSVFAIKKAALESIGEKTDEVITDDWLNRVLWKLRREYHNAAGKRPFRRRYNYDLGNITTGIYRIAVPSDLENPSTGENVYGVRIGNNANLAWMDKKEFDREWQDVAHSTLASDYAIVDGTITITDSRDFDESGSITIADDVIEYSANAESTGILTISTAGNEAHTAGVDVWQNASFGLPTKYAIFPDATGVNYIYFDKPISSDYADQNIFIDYYRTLVEYNSDADILDEPKFDFYINGLAFEIKKRRDKGKIDISTDSDFMLYRDGLKQVLATEYNGQSVYFTPAIDHLP